jgi:CheY-like chemotaxis protein
MTARTGTANHHQHVVLVVEDSGVARESLGLLLQMEGYRVATAPSGLEALHLLITLGFRPCVIITDLIMARMDGLTFRAEQRKHSEAADIPVIALTGHEGLRRHALDMDFAAALLKPCDFAELYGLIERHCARRGTLRIAKPA